MTKNFQLPATQIKEFQTRREMQDVKNALANLPIMLGNEAPEGVVAANPGTIYIQLTDPAQIFYKLSGNKSTGWATVLGNANVVWDAENEQLNIFGNDEALTVSNPNGAAGIGINKWGTGDRFAYLDFYSSGLPGAIDYSARAIRDPGVNAAWRFDQTGTGNVEFQRNGVTQLLLPNGQNFAFPSALTKYYSVGPMDAVTWNTGVDLLIPTVGGQPALRTSSTTGIIAGVHLPNGAIITAWDCYVYDANNPGTVTAVLRKWNLSTGEITNIGTAQTTSTTGTPGDTTLSQSGLSETVDNTTYSYDMRWFASSASDTLCFRGAKITYTVAGSASMS